LLYIAIAKNNDGFEKLNRFLSHHNQESKPLTPRAPEFDNVFIIYPFGKMEPDQLRSYEYIGISKHQLNQLTFYTPHKTHPEKFVILHPVTFAGKTDYNIHRLLRAIANNTLLSKLLPEQQAHPDEMMVQESDLKKHFRDYPHLIQNTQHLLEQCSIQFNLKADKNKKHVTGSAESDWDFLVTKSWEGFQDRYDASDPVLRERLQRELTIIKQKGFCSYYLVAYDLVCFAK
jgi:DNA polymerase III alpha subunit